MGSLPAPSPHGSHEGVPRACFAAAAAARRRDLFAPDNRRAVTRILRETKEDLPEYFRVE